MWCRHSIGQRLDSCAMRRTQKQWKDHHGAGNDNDYDYVMTICSFRKSGSCSFLRNPKSVINRQESREIRLLSFENLYLSGICQLVATTVTIKHANFALLLKPLCGYVQLHEEMTTFNLTHKRWWSTMPQRTKSPLRSPPYLEKHNGTQQMYLLAPWEICAVSWYQCTVQLNSSDNHNANMW